MKVIFDQYASGGITIRLIPETLKDAADLMYFNQNATPAARKVAQSYADAPDTKPNAEPLVTYIHLETKPEKHRTNQL